MKLNNNSTVKELSDIFKDKIIPLLQEYFYDDYEKIRLVLGDNQKVKDGKGYPYFIKIEKNKPSELFGENVADYDFDEKPVYTIISDKDKNGKDNPDYSNAYLYVYLDDNVREYAGGGDAASDNAKGGTGESENGAGISDVAQDEAAATENE